MMQPEDRIFRRGIWISHQATDRDMDVVVRGLLEPPGLAPELAERRGNADRRTRWNR